MKAGVLLLMLLAFPLPGLARTDYAKHVVSLSITYQSWDEDRPWAKGRPGTRGSSAVVIEGDRLLTLAGMVANATLIRAERNGDGREWNARIVDVDPEINLAMITVDDPAFFDGLAPARIARWAPTEGSVQAVRWKERQLEVSTSRVARMDMATNRYGNLRHLFLLVRTDVAAGGWSEPVFRDGDLVGLTSSQERDQRASVTPAEILSSYVEAVAAGDHRGPVSLGLSWQLNRDRVLASWLGQEGEPTGAILRGAKTGTSACGVFRPRDILLSLDGHTIDSVGNYQHPRYGRVRFAQIVVEDHRPGDVIPARVMRDGKVLDLEVPLMAMPPSARLIPWRRENAPPPYLVAGGLVFRELDGNYLRTWGGDWIEKAPVNLVQRHVLEGDGQRNDRRRVIILSTVLPDAYNVGYHDTRDVAIDTVNGRPIDSISGLVEAFEHPVNGFQVIVTEPVPVVEEIVLDAGEFEAASARILKAYGIPQAVRLEPPPEIEFDAECSTTY